MSTAIRANLVFASSRLIGNLNYAVFTVLNFCFVNTLLTVTELKIVLAILVVRCDISPQHPSSVLRLLRLRRLLKGRNVPVEVTMELEEGDRESAISSLTDSFEEEEEHDEQAQDSTRPRLKYALLQFLPFVHLFPFLSLPVLSMAQTVPVC